MSAPEPPPEPEWRVWPNLTPYGDAVIAMERRVAAIRDGSAREAIWLVEHPPTWTAGTSADAADVLDPGLDVVATGRGGRHTYHGPGQRVVYAMLDLDRRGRDVRHFVRALEAWIVCALAGLGVTGAAVPGRTGVWVGEAKIAAIGVRVRRWVTYHGFALNVSTDLAHYARIRPCGLDAPVTSLAALGCETSLAAVDVALAATCEVLLSSRQFHATSVQPARDWSVPVPLEALNDRG